jgi:UMF1 family MFS transporter
MAKEAEAPAPSGMPWLEKLGLHRPELRAWALYDVANSAWMTTIIMLFPLYFVGVAAADRPADTARSQFAFVTSLSVVLVGFLGPLLGAMADLRGNKKGFLGAFLALGASATAAMYLVTEGRFALAVTTFVVANVGVTSTLAFYNALLPGIAKPEEVDRVSTAGFALGYLGGGLLFAVNSMMIASPARFGLADTNMAIRASFLSVALWWVVFAVPLFLRVPEPAARREPGEAPGQALIPVAVGRLKETFHELRRHRDAGLLLLAFLVYNDGINTIIRMATTYGSEIGIAREHLIGALLMVQFVGVPFAFAFGLLSDRIGPKTSILLALAVYSLIAIYAFSLRTATQFYVLAFLVGTVQGGAQGLSRSLFASLIPKHKAGEMFGFFGVFDRFGGAMGTLLFGIVLAATGSSRPAIVSVIAFFLIGAFLLTRVDVERGRLLAEEENRKAAPVLG